MALSKQRAAALVKRFPAALSAFHAVWRFTRPHFSAGAIGVLFNPLGEVLIVEHVYHRYPLWGLPGGYVERGEDPSESLARELHEELDLRAEVGKVVAVEKAYGNHLDIAYLCHSTGSVGQLCGELLDYRWVLPESLPDMRAFHRQAIFAALAVMDVKV